MSGKKGGFSELLFSTIMPKVYGIGAAIVIVGAMFKILHLPGAGEMLGIGLTTEAIIFLLSAFEPKHKDPDWAKVYPELADDYEGAPRRKAVGQGAGTAASLDKMLADGKVGPELVKSLGDGMRHLADSARKMTNLGNASVATSEYAKNITMASKSMQDMNRSYGATVQAMSSMADATKDAKEYHSQVQNVTKSLSALNALYEMELKDSQSHTKALNKFYTNMSEALENMATAGKETAQFQRELNNLTSNLASLNKVYGSMLTAMRGGGGAPSGGGAQ